MLGKVVLQGILNNNESIDISSLQQGYYIVKLNNTAESFYASFTKL
jgi:hypothetical protein